MPGSVSFGRRNLLADRRRLAASYRDEFAADPGRFPLLPEKAAS